MEFELNIKEFNRGLDRYKKAVSKKPERICKAVAQALHSRVTLLTSVDTGYARAGWRLESRWSPWTPDSGSEHYPAPETPSLGGLTSPEWWVYNNVAYIRLLEHGHSAQAPASMTAVALDESAGIFTEAAKKCGWV